MNELKVYKMVDEKYCTDCVCVIPSEVYLKDEADKVIAEKDERIDLYKRGWEESDRINTSIYKEIRYQKYKRCLVMADFCESEYHRNYAVGNGFWLVRGDKETRDKYRKKADDFWWKWHNRWLELAEKFKEAK